jgi:hypothetical protein
MSRVCGRRPCAMSLPNSAISVVRNVLSTIDCGSRARTGVGRVISLTPHGAAHRPMLSKTNLEGRRIFVKWYFLTLAKLCGLFQPSKASFVRQRREIGRQEKAVHCHHDRRRAFYRCLSCHRDILVPSRGFDGMRTFHFIRGGWELET